MYRVWQKYPNNPNYWYNDVSGFRIWYYQPSGRYAYHNGTQWMMTSADMSKWIPFKESLFLCQSLLGVCADDPQIGPR